ncbi:MAG: Inner membrane protein YphA [Paracidovorax wautersii]|uniref:Inner membrane protein YphA n=1 Tax=Paracidovorax wautersii TaxID=1177982 RepID=A0A7V8JR82_9BURK|nr:MAG: Inner membrane protein YphA [Paracidovorax wautersii]
MSTTNVNATATALSTPVPAGHVLDGARNALLLLGRLLIAYLFIPAGWGKLVGFGGAVGYIAATGLPLPAVGAVIAIVVELGIGLLLLIGWQTRWAALVLALFALATTVFFHPVWADPAQAVNFGKNLAIAGGLLSFAVVGAGAFSVDGRRARG